MAGDGAGPPWGAGDLAALLLVGGPALLSVVQGVGIGAASTLALVRRASARSSAARTFDQPLDSLLVVLAGLGIGVFEATIPAQPLGPLTTATGGGDDVTTAGGLPAPAPPPAPAAIELLAGLKLTALPRPSSSCSNSLASSMSALVRGLVPPGLFVVDSPAIALAAQPPAGGFHTGDGKLLLLLLLTLLT